MRIFLLCLLSISSFCVAQQENVEELFEKAYFLETVEHNLEEAVKIYQKIVDFGDDTSIGKKAKERLEQIGWEDDIWEESEELEIESESENAFIHIVDVTNIEQYLDSVNISIDFAEVPFVDVLKFLSNIARINIVYTGQVTSRINESKVTLRLLKVSLKKCIELLCNFFDLDYVVLYDALIIGNQKEIDQLKNKKVSAIPQGIIDTFTMDFSETPIEEIISFITMTCPEANIVVHPSVYKKYPENTFIISMNVKYMNLYNVLNLLCIQAGDLYLKYEDSIFIIDLKQHKKVSLLDLTIQQDVRSEKNNYPDINVILQYQKTKDLFIKSHTNLNSDEVISYQQEIESDRGNLLLTVEQPGYHSIMKEVNIKEDEVIKVDVVLLAKERLLSFSMFDKNKNRLVTAETVMINGEKSSFKDTYKPGKKIEIEITFADYEDYKASVTVTPGEGPFIVEVPLVAKK